MKPKNKEIWRNLTLPILADASDASVAVMEKILNLDARHQRDLIYYLASQVMTFRSIILPSPWLDATIEKENGQIIMSINLSVHDDHPLAKKLPEIRNRITNEIIRVMESHFGEAKNFENYGGKSENS